MNTGDLREALFGIVRDVLGKPDLDLSDSTTAAEVEGWDSLRQVLLIVAAEERFGIRFSNKEVDSFNCLGDLLAVLKAKIG